LGPSDAFKQSITERVKTLCEKGLPRRAGQFVSALSNHYGTQKALDSQHYQLRDL
jgi:elongation factor P hydroxylase